MQTAKASRKQSSLSGKESAQGCIPKRLPGRPDEALGGGKQGPSAPAWARQHHRQRDPPFVPRKRLPDWASPELSPSVESWGCGLGPSPVRLGEGEHSPRAGDPGPEQRAPGKCSVPRPGSPVPSTPERREGLQACYWEGPSELPERRSSSSAPRRGSAEPRPRGCSGLGEPRPALPSF